LSNELECFFLGRGSHRRIARIAIAQENKCIKIADSIHEGHYALCSRPRLCTYQSIVDKYIRESTDTFLGCAACSLLCSLSKHFRKVFTLKVAFIQLCFIEFA